MAGRDDVFFPPEHQGQLAAGILHARLQIVERAGHEPYSRAARRGHGGRHRLHLRRRADGLTHRLAGCCLAACPAGLAGLGAVKLATYVPRDVATRAQSQRLGSIQLAGDLGIRRSREAMRRPPRQQVAGPVWVAVHRRVASSRVDRSGAWVQPEPIWTPALRAADAAQHLAATCAAQLG